MASSNPILGRARAIAATAPRDAAAGEMTVAGTIQKTLVLSVLVVASALYTWMRVSQGADVTPLILIGAFGGLIAAIATGFAPNLALISAPIYAVLEGLALGSISALINSEPKYAGLPVQAVMLTMVVFVGMAGLYRARIIQATAKFQAILFAATFGVFVFYMLDIGLSFFGAQMPLVSSPSPMGIAFSILVCGIAAFNLITDFAMIESLVAERAPKSMEWYGAFGLIVTLVWLYLETLRLLRKVRR